MLAHTVCLVTAFDSFNMQSQVQQSVSPQPCMRLCTGASAQMLYKASGLMHWTDVAHVALVIYINISVCHDMLAAQWLMTAWMFCCCQHLHSH